MIGWRLLNAAAFISLLMLFTVSIFFLGKSIGPDEAGNSNRLYWGPWPMNLLWWLSAGKVPLTNIDLELAIAVLCVIAPALAGIRRVRARRRAATGNAL